MPPGGWYLPGEKLTGILYAELRRKLPEADVSSLVVTAFNQDRNHLLFRRRDVPTRVVLIDLNCQRGGKSKVHGPPVIFEGTFADFVAREAKRFELERRMDEKPIDVPGICPLCFAHVIDQGCCGIWTGSIRSKASNGPLHQTSCESCLLEVAATPTKEEAARGVFHWRFLEWHEEGASPAVHRELGITWPV